MRIRGDWRARPLGLWLAAAVAAMALPGCGGGNPYRTVPVTGKLTYRDGSLIPARRIQVNFIPQVKAIDLKTHPRFGVAYLDVETGEFTAVTTATYGDGATVGKNKLSARTSCRSSPWTRTNGRAKPSRPSMLTQRPRTSR